MKQIEVDINGILMQLKNTAKNLSDAEMKNSMSGGINAEDAQKDRQKISHIMNDISSAIDKSIRFLDIKHRNREMK